MLRVFENIPGISGFHYFPLVHNDHLIIPYAVSDYSSAYATVKLKELLQELKDSMLEEETTSGQMAASEFNRDPK